MIQNIRRILVGLPLLLLVLVLVVSAITPRQSIEDEVDEVLARVQSRNGQTVEWLVELGQPAVPAICQRLKTYSHPMVIVNALAKLGDPRATEPLIELLDTLKPLSGDVDYTARCIRVINALKEIGDLRAEKRLVDIMAGESAYMRVRLYAAGALARFGSPSVKEQARTFIMSAYVERSKYIRSSLDHDFLYQDMYVALCEVGTDEALDIVLNVLRADAMPYEKMAILKYLPKREDEKIVTTLLEISAGEADEVHIRLKALDILMTFESKVSIADLRTRLDDLEQCDLIHEIPEFKRQFNALIKQLSQREPEKEPVGQIVGLLSQDKEARKRLRAKLIKYEAAYEKYEAELTDEQKNICQAQLDVTRARLNGRDEKQVLGLYKQLQDLIIDEAERTRNKPVRVWRGNSSLWRVFNIEKPILGTCFYIARLCRDSERMTLQEKIGEIKAQANICNDYRIRQMAIELLKKNGQYEDAIDYCNEQISNIEQGKKKGRTSVYRYELIKTLLFYQKSLYGQAMQDQGIDSDQVINIGPHLVEIDLAQWRMAKKEAEEYIRENPKYAQRCLSLFSSNNSCLGPIAELKEVQEFYESTLSKISEDSAQAEVVSPAAAFFPPMTMLAQEELKPLLEEWDKAIESDRLQEKGKAIMKVANYVPEDMRFRGSRVLRYSNPEIKGRIIALYLKECAKANQPPPDVRSETNPWHGGERGAEYMIFLMTMAESTFDPRIYETELKSLGVSGDLWILYLATVNAEKTLKYLFESKLGQRIGKRGHQDFFYHGETAWSMSVDSSYSLLSLMTLQSPEVLRNNRVSILTFVSKHAKHYASPRKVKYKSTPVYLKWQDYDVRNGALDVLGLLGTSEDIKTVEDIIRDAPQIDPKRLNGGPRDRREQIRQKGIRIIEQIRQRTANIR